MATSKIDLSQLLKTYAKKYEKAFKDLIKKKTGIDRQSYSPLKNKRPSGHKKSLDSRLNDSGYFARNAVTVTSDDISLTIEGNTGKHPSGISYNDILVYNSKDSGNTNTNITNPPLVFPTKVDEFENMDITKQFYKDLQRTLEIQLGEDLKDIKFPTNIKIG